LDIGRVLAPADGYPRGFAPAVLGVPPVRFGGAEELARGAVEVEREPWDFWLLRCRAE